MLHYNMHVTPLCALCKLLKALCRTTSIVTDVPHTSRFSQKKVSTRPNVVVETSTSVSRSLGTVEVKVHNCIPRSRIVYIDTTGFLFMVR